MRGGQGGEEVGTANGGTMRGGVAGVCEGKGMKLCRDADATIRVQGRRRARCLFWLFLGKRVTVNLSSVCNWDGGEIYSN